MEKRVAVDDVVEERRRRRNTACPEYPRGERNSANVVEEKEENIFTNKLIEDNGTFMCLEIGRIYSCVVHPYIGEDLYALVLCKHPDADGDKKEYFGFLTKKLPPPCFRKSKNGIVETQP